MMPPRVVIPMLALALAQASCHELTRERAAAEESAPSPSPTAAATAAGRTASPEPGGEKRPRIELAEDFALDGGAAIRLPKGAKEVETRALARLPGEVEEAHVFHVGDPRRLLMVGEMSREGKDCEAVIADQLDKAKGAEKDGNEKRLKLRRMAEVQAVELDGTRAVYTEAKHKGFAGGAVEREFVGMHTVSVCRDETFLVLVYVSDQPPPEGGPRELLLGMARTFEPPSR